MCQIIGGIVIVIMLPLVALPTKSASFIFTHLELAPKATRVSSKPYAIILSFLVSQYFIYGFDFATHLIEETKGAYKNGPIAILGSIGIIIVFGWAYILALTFNIQVNICKSKLLIKILAMRLLEHLFQDKY